VRRGWAQPGGPSLTRAKRRYLRRSDREWRAGRHALEVFEGIVDAVRRNDVRQIGALTTQNWEGPLKSIIPWVTNQFTETIIERARAALGNDFWGFLMLGGMSGGGMAFFVAPHRRARVAAAIEAADAVIQAG